MGNTRRVLRLNVHAFAFVVAHRFHDTVVKKIGRPRVVVELEIPQELSVPDKLLAVVRPAAAGWDRAAFVLVTE